MTSIKHALLTRLGTFVRLFDSNRLTGSIPEELGGVSTLQVL